MAGELGRTSVAVQRGWEALRAIGWSLPARGRSIRTGNPTRALEFKKKLTVAVEEETAKHPGSLS